MGGEPLTDAELRAEMARLRAENEALREQTAPPEPTTGRWRSFWVWVLVVVACVAVAGSAIAVWARTTALDTDTFVDTVAPLPQDPEVSTALADRLVEEVFRDVDLEAELSQALPEGLGFIAAPLASGVQDLAVDIARRIIASDAFRTLWETAMRLAHNQAVAVLTGREAIVITAEGEVALDLGDAVSNVRSGLEEAGLGDLLPAPREEGALVVLFNDTQLGVLQTTVDLLDMVYWGLPLVAVLAIAGALWLSHNRRKTLFRLGIGVVIAAAVALLIMDLARGEVVAQIETPQVAAAISDTWDILFRNLTNAYGALLVLALLVAVAAFLAGPHRWAVSFRQAAGRQISGWRSGDRLQRAQQDRVGGFLGEHTAGARMLGVIGALLFLFFWPRLTVGIVIVTAVVLVVYLLVVELLRSAPAPVVPEGGPREESAAVAVAADEEEGAAEAARPGD